MECAIKLVERFIAGVSKPARPSTPEAETNPHQYDGPPRTAEQVAAYVRPPRLRSGIFSARESRPPIPNARPLPRTQGVFANNQIPQTSGNSTAHLIFLLQPLFFRRIIARPSVMGDEPTKLLVVQRASRPGHCTVAGPPIMLVLAQLTPAAGHPPCRHP